MVTVSFPTGSACQRKFCGMAVPVALLKTDVDKVIGCESLPAVTVPVPVAGKVRTPRTVALPFTSRVASGAVVPTPIFAVVPVPVCVMAEL